MTAELAAQKARLLQAERVAAWRELSKHEHPKGENGSVLDAGSLTAINSGVIAVSPRVHQSS